MWNLMNLSLRKTGLSAPVTYEPDAVPGVDVSDLAAILAAHDVTT